MDLDQLQAVRDRERGSDGLQELRESFYADATAFIADLRRERAAAAEDADDPFDSPRVTRLTDRIRTAEQTLEAIYEKRVGKVVEAATFAAAGLPADADGMTVEEADLFETLVAEIEANRETVLGRLEVADDALPGSDAVAVDGDDAGPNAGAGGAGHGTADRPPGAPDPNGPDATEPEPPTERRPPPESSSESTRAEPPSAEPDPDSEEKAEPPDEPDQLRDGEEKAEPPDEPDPDGEEGAEPPDEPDQLRDGGEAANEPPSAEAPEASDVERELVRITEDVGAILGVDDREYDLAEDDVVTLPAANARPLIEQGVAERLE
jgi:DNA replication factor GINS